VRFQYLVYLLRPTALGTSGGLTMYSASLLSATTAAGPATRGSQVEPYDLAKWPVRS
jgi:hypothetical protein